MTLNPLARPELDSPLLQRFLAANRIERAGAPIELLTRVVAAFSRLPFENLTKILKEAASGQPAAARRSPAEVLDDHWRLGAGGTCFALTATLLHLVRALGWQAEPILADRRFGEDTHSALLVWIDGEPHLLDPGYLIVRPLPLPTTTERTVATAFNDLRLAPRARGQKIDLYTHQDGQSTYRLTFKAAPVDAGEFLRAWDASFEADMMRYPVLSRVVEGRQLYLQKRHILVRGRDGAQRRELTPDALAGEIARAFGVDADVVARALGHLRRKGEMRG